MKETLRYLKQQAVEAADVAKIQWQSFLLAVIVMGFFYIMSLLFPAGWVSYAFIVPPSFVVAITALARVNDIGPEKMGRRWQYRKISLILVGAGAVMVMSTPFIDVPMFPSWRAVVLMYGVAGTWMTTPGMPPWDYYITGKFRFLAHPPGEPMSPIHRIVRHVTGELSREEVLAAQKAWEEREARDKTDGTRAGDGPEL